MTDPDYRCPWCGSTSSQYRSVIIAHMVNQHRAAILEDLERARPFGSRKPIDPPRNALKGHPVLNPGVSGEGDS